MTDNGANMVAAVHKAGWRHHEFNSKGQFENCPGSGESAGKMERLCPFFFLPQHTGHTEAQRYSTTVHRGKAQANPVSRYSLEFSFFYMPERGSVSKMKL